MRDLLDELGRAFDLIKSAHYSVRAAQRGGIAREAAVGQWAYGVHRYTAVLEALCAMAPAPPPPPPPLTEAQCIERVRSQVIGRIVGGRFVREGDK